MAQTAHNKKVLLEALEKTLGVVTTACNESGIPRRTHYNWYESDSDYRKSVDELSNVALDFAESKLHINISKGDTTAIIFYLKTKGKERGYIEKQYFDHTTNGKEIQNPEQIKAEVDKAMRVLNESRGSAKDSN